jgi:hypothetical protein
MDARVAEDARERPPAEPAAELLRPFEHRADSARLLPEEPAQALPGR